MAFLDIFKSKKIQNMSKTIDKQANQIQNLVYEIGQLRISVDGAPESGLKYGWNRFKDYPDWVEKIHEICRGEHDWGLSVLATMYQRAGFVGGTIEINLNDPEKEKERAFVEKFLEVNNLNEAGLIEMLANIEREARILLILTRDEKYKWNWTDEAGKLHEEIGMTMIKYLSYLQGKYKIIPDKNNKEIAKQFTFESDNETLGPFDEHMFVYSRYRGTPNDLNTSMSLFQVCFEHIVALERCYFDFNLNNHLFAQPWPVVKCNTYQDAKSTNDLLNASSKGFKVNTRKILAMVGDLKLTVPDHPPAIENEIKEHIEAISRITGIPAQHLGRADAVRNKNVAENMMAGLAASIKVDRDKCEKWLQELAIKAINMANGTLTPMDSTAIQIKIGDMSAADWERLVNVYLPARENKFISEETFLEKIPGLDVGLEKERLEAEKKEEDEKKEKNRDKFFDSIVSNDRAEFIERSNNERKESKTRE